MTNEQRRMNNDPGAAGGREDHTGRTDKSLARSKRSFTILAKGLRGKTISQGHTQHMVDGMREEVMLVVVRLLFNGKFRQKKEAGSENITEAARTCYSGHFVQTCCCYRSTIWSSIPRSF